MRPVCRHRGKGRSIVTGALTGAFALLSLAGSAPAQAGGALQDTLSKTRAFMQQFTDDFSYLRYEEDVVQEKLKNNDKVVYKQEIVYDSMIRTRFEDGRLRVDEERLLDRRPKHVESRPLLNTYGFSTLAMVFHPYYESSFRFKELGSDVVDGKSVIRVQFDHLPGTPTPVLYQMIGPDRPLDVTGTAWINPATGEICRIDAAFETGVSDMGVKTIRAELVYGSVSLRDENTPMFLPVSATIDLETPRQHWRNVHHFSDYRKYRVAISMPGAPTQ